MTPFALVLNTQNESIDTTHRNAVLAGKIHCFLASHIAFVDHVIPFCLAGDRTRCGVRGERHALVERLHKPCYGGRKRVT
jgi:hypothetical protein